MEITFDTINATFEAQAEAELADYATWAYEAAQRFAATMVRPTIKLIRHLSTDELCELAEAGNKHADRLLRIRGL